METQNADTNISRHLSGAVGGARWQRAAGQLVVMGIGNILLKDDGAGVWVVRELAKHSLAGPIGDVAFVEAGVAGLDLLPVVNSARHLIIVDAMIRGGRPGSVYQLDAGDILGPQVPQAPQMPPSPGRMMPRGIRRAIQCTTQRVAQREIRYGARCRTQMQQEASEFPVTSAHDIGLPQLLWHARQLGTLCPAAIFGIEPAIIDYGIGLSDELQRALPEIVRHIAQFIAQFITQFPDSPA
ncbi:MAG: hydrogenase maturation protease [Firmicutes bacterium]|nr:hydrogenase maturation protease [Bacillota bacterium]